MHLLAADTHDNDTRQSCRLREHHRQRAPRSLPALECIMTLAISGRTNIRAERRMEPERCGRLHTGCCKVAARAGGWQMSVAPAACRVPRSAAAGRRRPPPQRHRRRREAGVAGGGSRRCGERPGRTPASRAPPATGPATAAAAARCCAPRRRARGARARRRPEPRRPLALARRLLRVLTPAAATPRLRAPVVTAVFAGRCSQQGQAETNHSGASCRPVQPTDGHNDASTCCGVTVRAAHSQLATA